jgi:hypothetical protein
MSESFINSISFSNVFKLLLMNTGSGGGGWSSDYSSGYGNSYGGGPVRGGGSYSQRGSGPYGGEFAIIAQSLYLH